jgi:hypothetical protein
MQEPEFIEKQKNTKTKLETDYLKEKNTHIEKNSN